ncbi:unnamed protein product [Lota lota]
MGGTLGMLVVLVMEEVVLVVLEGMGYHPTGPGHECGEKLVVCEAQGSWFTQLAPADPLEEGLNQTRIR